MTDVVKQIRKFNAGRDPERLAMKYRNMRSDPFVFLRGTCHLFYARLPAEPVLRKAPATWACGDLHLENFGSYQGDNRLAYFDINDFDESALAPATWDLVRFLCSVLVGRGSLQVTLAEALELCSDFLNAYADALAQGQARWIERETAPSPVSDLLESVQRRQRAEFLDRRTVEKNRRRNIRVDGRKALAATPRQMEQVTAFFERFAAKQLDPGFFKVRDVARRIAGTGSLGVDRYIVLVEGKGSPDGNYLLDLKQALPSSIAKRTALPQPAWRSEAQRAVAVQRRMQAVSMAFLQAVRMGSESYVLRALQPSEDRIAPAPQGPATDRLKALMAVTGQCVAWAQLRSSGRQGSAVADELIDFGEQRKWRKALLALARHGADTVEADWRTFAEAYDDGVFGSS